MTDVPIEPPSGPIDPNDKPPVKPKGRSHEQDANQENVGSSESEGQTASTSEANATNE